MKKFFAIILTIIFVLGLVLVSPKILVAKGSEPIVFINYTAKNGKAGICRQTTNDQVNIFTSTGWRLQQGLTDYKINYSTKPRGWSDDSFGSVINSAFATVQDAGGGPLFHYAGESREVKVRKDGQNTVMWQNLPNAVAAMTYIWTENGRLKDADTIFNKKYLWTYTPYNGSNDCGGSAKSFDLRDVATHEFGHWVGLGDLYDTKAQDLTMYGLAVPGELKKDSLGLGDITGVRALWP